MRWLGQLGRRFRVDVSIAVPAATPSHLRLVDGSVIASGLRKSTHVDVTSGQVTLLGLHGHTRAKLVSGPVETLGGAGDLTTETVSGELVLADSSAERAHAKTVSGSITSAFPQISPGKGSSWSKESRGILGAGEGKLWVATISGGIALLSRPVTDDDEENAR